MTVELMQPHVRNEWIVGCGLCLEPVALEDSYLTVKPDGLWGHSPTANPCIVCKPCGERKIGGEVIQTKQADMPVGKGRGNRNRGEKAPGSKLTTAQVRSIKALIRAGDGTTEIARRFGVARATIDMIKHGRTWVDVE